MALNPYVRQYSEDPQCSWDNWGHLRYANVKFRLRSLMEYHQKGGAEFYGLTVEEKEIVRKAVELYQFMLAPNTDGMGI